jgi:phytoene synthase
MFNGRPVRQHPTAQALAAAIARRGLVRAPLEAMIDGQIEALEAARLGPEAAVHWGDAVQGSVCGLVAAVLDPATDTAAVAAAGRAWGIALLVRSGLAERSEVAGPMRSALSEARFAARGLSVAALPAALPARLARYDLAGQAPGPLRKRLALTLAAATGRI